MDDIFQLLIWLFIIISFFSSFFRKKTPDKQAPPRNYEPQEPVARDQSGIPAGQSGRSVDREEYDILQEIENMFKTSTSQPTKLEEKEQKQPYYGMDNEPVESEHVSYETTRRQDEYTSYERERSPLETQKMDTSRRESERVLTASEHSFEVLKRPALKTRQEIRKIDESVSKQADDFEKFLNKKVSTYTMASTVREKLRNPSSVREYIIMSEILRRPSFKRGRVNAMQR